MECEIPGKCKVGKRKRVVLTLKQKIDICKRLENGESRNALMKEYNIGSSTIYDIKAQKEKLVKYFASSDIHKTQKTFERRRTLQTPKLEQLHEDTVSYDEYSLKRSEDTSITGPLFLENEKDFYKHMDMTEPCSYSEGWHSGFKLRHGIKKLDASAEQNSADHESAERYCEFFNNFIVGHDLTPEQIYNADETTLFWRCLPNSALAGTSESIDATFKINKDRLTVLSCSNAAGSHKVKLMVIGKNNRPRAFRTVAHLPVVYKTQRNAQMDKDIFYEWFHHVFVPSVEEHFREIGKPEDSKVILLLDNCRAHYHESDLTSGNIFTIFLPASVTPLIQPMDQGIIQNLKFFYRRDFLRKLISHEGSVQDFQTDYNMKDAIFNVACAWNCVKRETLKKAWRKLWPNVMFMEASSDDNVVEGYTERQRTNTLAEIMEMVKDIPSAHPFSKLQESEVEEWIEADKEANSLIDAEIMETVMNPEHMKDTEKDSEEEDLTGYEEDKITWAKAAMAFDIIIKFAERQPCYTAQEVVQLHTLRSTFMQKRQKTNKQTDIRDLFKNAARACHRINTYSVQSPSTFTVPASCDTETLVDDAHTNAS